jgi:hypothetical protein
MLEAMEPLDGIALADVHLGRRTPLPALALPLVRWVDVTTAGPRGVEIAWNLDDTREGDPGRLALYAGRELPPPHALEQVSAVERLDGAFDHRSAPLPTAQPSLRPVHELCWQADGLHLRLTAQGPWSVGELVEIARSVG